MPTASLCCLAAWLAAASLCWLLPLCQPASQPAYLQQIRTQAHPPQTESEAQGR